MRRGQESELYFSLLPNRMYQHKRFSTTKQVKQVKHLAFGPVDNPPEPKLGDQRFDNGGSEPSVVVEDGSIGGSRRTNSTHQQHTQII